jgi:hypothetical protein
MKGGRVIDRAAFSIFWVFGIDNEPLWWGRDRFYASQWGREREKSWLERGRERDAEREREKEREREREIGRESWLELIGASWES